MGHKRQYWDVLNVDQYLLVARVGSEAEAAAELARLRAANPGREYRMEQLVPVVCDCWECERDRRRA